MAVRIKMRAQFQERTSRLGERFRRQTRNGVVRQAAYVRVVAKRSIRRRKRVSQPGRPPTSQTGILKNSIRFAYNRFNNTAIVGPIWLKHFRAPRALEFGGTSRWLVRRRGLYQSGLQRVRARPFMFPALMKSSRSGALRRILRDSYRRDPLRFF